MDQDRSNGDSVRSVATSLTPQDFDSSFSDSQEPIFPPELQLSDDFDQQFLLIKGDQVTWYRPTNLDQLLALKTQFPYAKLVVGNTEVALEMKFRHCEYPVMINPVMVAETQIIQRNEDCVVLGGAVSIDTFQQVLREEIARRPEEATRIFTSIVEMLHWFAGKQIRNVAAIAGNIMTGSPISDLNPIFLAAGCELELQSQQRGTRRVVMDHTFFTAYRKNIVLEDEVLVSISVPTTEGDEYFAAYKQSRRREDDIAIVNAAFHVTFHPQSSRIAKLKMAFGGMAPTTVMAKGTMEKLIGRCWEEDSFMEDACNYLLQDLPLPPSVPGGMSSFRQSLCLSFFFKFHLKVHSALHERSILAQGLAPALASGVGNIPRGQLKSTQLFEVVPKDQSNCDPIGRPLTHMAASKQVTGEAIYCDDLPPLNNQLYMTLVFSNRAHAEILSIDSSAALALDGVHGVYTAREIMAGRNRYGPILKDDEVFADGKVTCCGQIVACVVAETQALSQKASRLVKVNYKDLEPVIITIEEAIKAESFYHEHSKRICNGNVEEAMKEADHVLEGTFQMAGQEHFYLETNAVVVNPKGEDGELEIYCSTQNPTEIQLVVAEVLDIPANRVVCKVKRMGGGFGGKETKGPLIALPAAVASFHLQRPVRCMMDRDEDMMSTGTRHPFVAKYRVAFNKDGRITALHVRMYSNGGNSMDLSRSVMERAVFHIENSYRIPNIDCHGWVCRTNLPSNTAFRGFGGPQGMMVGENIVSNVASYLKMDPLVVRSLNLYQEGDRTHYNQTLDHCTLERCWSECRVSSRLDERRSSIDSFNQANRYKKRGIAMVPTKFGIAFTALFLNQAGALVHIYKDGSVLLTHGGTEMGQGLHTKMIQVASRALGVPVEDIFISETSTDKVPNTSPTAASVGSDINGMAVLNACQTIVDRLEPVRQSNPKGSWRDWIIQAYFQRISLSATGFYKTPDIGYNFDTNTGRAFRYYTYGVACSEVEVDCLTGDHRVLRTDIIMDLGESLNPAIDIGQVEGGFVQGLGLFTLEEPLYSTSGQVITRGPSNYKIPTADDIPEEFNVSLLRGSPNPHAVYSSKAVGEPPLFLASSVFFAIRDAVESARAEIGLTGLFQFNSPATAERIRMACEDQLTNKISKPEPGTFKPWAVSV